MTDVDLARVAPEIRRALDEQAVLLPEQLTPGLLSRPEPGELVILSQEGEELCRVPLYRLLRPDYDRLGPYVAASLDRLSPDDATTVRRALANDEQAIVYDPPDSEWVGVMVAGVKVALVHRSRLVDGWPGE
jgi:hypothetical protein